MRLILCLNPVFCFEKGKTLIFNESLLNFVPFIHSSTISARVSVCMVHCTYRCVSWAPTHNCQSGLSGAVYRVSMDSPNLLLAMLMPLRSIARTSMELARNSIAQCAPVFFTSSLSMVMTVLLMYRSYLHRVHGLGFLSPFSRRWQVHR